MSDPMSIDNSIKQIEQIQTYPPLLPNSYGARAGAICLLKYRSVIMSGSSQMEDRELEILNIVDENVQKLSSSAAATGTVNVIKGKEAS